MECIHNFQSNIGHESLDICIYCNDEKVYERVKNIKYTESSILHSIKNIFKFYNQDIIEKTIMIYESTNKDIVLRGKKRLKCILASLYMALYIINKPISQYEFLEIINKNTDNKYNFNKNNLHYGKKYIRENIYNDILFNQLTIFDNTIDEMIRNIVYSLNKLNNNSISNTELLQIINYTNDYIEMHKKILMNRDEKSIVVFCISNYFKINKKNELLTIISNIQDINYRVSNKTLKYIENDLKLIKKS